MARWNAAETGILRKKSAPEKLEELLVFGYACKLFRDDEKALYIDQGKHLIPWMGDDKLRIDRYDCRGAISDLTPYESSREGYDAMRWLGLSESERKIEQLCDEERYYSLRTNEEEEMYKEEELKRLQQKTNEFSYSYDVPQNPEALRDSNPAAAEEEDKEYVPSPELHVPADIAIPETEKENARIEKTAHFVSKQGPQMEILIKAKQSDNPQFSFLNQIDPLHKYYKHVLSAIKAGSYKVETITAEEPKKETMENDANEDYYLHPSLQTLIQSPMPEVPTVSYKPTADCTYSQLVNRIQGSQTEISSQNIQAQNQTTYEQQYYQYYYAMQYYEYYKQMIAQFHNMGDTDANNIPPHIQEQINAQATTCAQMAYMQYMQQNASNPYAQIVSNLSQSKDNVSQFPPMSNVQDTSQMSDISKAPVIYGLDGNELKRDTAQVDINVVPKEEYLKEPREQRKVAEVAAKESKKALLSLVHYGSDSDESSASEEKEEASDQKTVDAFMVPPEETKVIIDKMASYVSKNGTDFENIVMAKGDARFQFLNESHEYYNYYKHKITEFAGVDKIEQESTLEAKPEMNGLQFAKMKEKKVITPVSFSIKKPKEEIPKDIKSALPVEESDEEETGDNANQSSQNTTASASNTASSSIAANLTTFVISNLTGSATSKEESLAPTSGEAASILEQMLKDKVKRIEAVEKKIGSTAKKGSVDMDDPILEMIDLTEDFEERKDARRAEDKIKDKLAAAAREKLASASKDRALQLERKKKAAAFLKLKSVESDAKTQAKNKKEEKAVSDDKVLIISDNENKSDYLDKMMYRKSRNRTRDKYSKKKVEPSDSEEGEIRKRRKSSKKKRSHKRKHSRSRHENRSHHHKKSKKKRRRSDSYHTSGSTTS